MRAKKNIKVTSKEKNAEASDKIVANFPIVGIGASAGGLEAFEEFFRYCAADVGMAFVLVPHLDPTHPSLLTEILQRTTIMHVCEAVDQLAVQPNCVYIIPPNRDIAIFHGKLQLTLPIEPRGMRLPIDSFFRSLAEDQHENAIGIIFSGTGSDGTLGAGAIHGAGGLVLVQDPATAKYEGMPNSVIHAGFATYVQQIKKMPEQLVNGVHLLTSYKLTAPDEKTSISMDKILMQLRTATGHDFSWYKKSTIGRRIERRMLQHDINDIQVYARYLKEYPTEIPFLFKELLINVTSFFRDKEAFELLQKEILPKLCANKADDYIFRVWVAGCATGEEAYSIAILLREILDKTLQIFKVQIYATDLSEGAINTARAGLYPINIIQDVSPERLRRYFTKESDGYKVKKEIRDMVIFATQNVIKDPPFTKLDLLCCRNVLIYLEAELQNKLIPTFHYSLKSGGVLFLSPSEGIGNFTEMFTPIDRKWQFYLANKGNNSGKQIIAAPLIAPISTTNKPVEKVMKPIGNINLAELSKRLLVQYFAPASVLTDNAGNIFYVHGETGKYLRPAPGQASLNVVEMACGDIKSELRSAIHLAAQEGKATLNREIPVNVSGVPNLVSISVRLLPTSVGAYKNLLMVSFQDVARSMAKPTRKAVPKSAELIRIKALEDDLMLLEEKFETVKQEYQETTEELKSSNEEMQSTNEEMQSSNEELETSKEELQSVNEELVAVNAELQTKMDQLYDIQNDMKNLLDSINIGIIYLDKHLMIRSFTREAVRVYRLVPADVGRPLSDIRSISDKADDLIILAKQVIDTLIPYEGELHILSSLMQVRIQPYRTLDSFIDGVIITFSDITARLREGLAFETLRFANAIVNSVHEPLLVLDSKLYVISASDSFYEQFQVQPNETEGYAIYELGNHQWNIPALRKLLEEILPEDESFNGFIVEHDFPTLGHRKMSLNARRFVSKVGEPQLILLSIEVDL